MVKSRLLTKEKQIARNESTVVDTCEEASITYKKFFCKEDIRKIPEKMEI